MINSLINGTLTTQDLFLAQIESEYTTKEQVIRKYINEHDVTQAEEGERYYYNENDIKQRQMKVYNENGELVIDEDAINHKNSNNFHKLLVDQKTLYLFGRQPTFTYSDTKLEDYTSDLIDFRLLSNDLNELCTASSNKGVEYLHVNIDTEGTFEYVVIPMEQLIPIYGTTNNKRMEAAIRYYPVWNNEVKTIRVEYWDKETVTYYIEEDGVLVPDPLYPEGEHIRPHFKYRNQGINWGRVPFIEFKNNNSKVYDLKFYKDLIDSYDRNISDLDNNLDEIQEAIIAISGAAATPAAELKANLRRHKIIKTDGPNSGVDKIEINIPIAATKELLDRLENNIFVFGQGINTLTDVVGEKSGEALKFLYQVLDLKANKTERMFQLALSEFFYFVTLYINLDNNTSFTEKDITTTLNRTLITNDKEKSEIAKNSVNILDMDTILKNHPWVSNEDIETIKNNLDNQRGTNRL